MNIAINTLSLTSQFDMSKYQVEDFIDYVIKDITASFARKWEGAAKRKLHSSRELYVSGLKVIDEGRMKGAVLLDYNQHKLIKMLEEGANAFDMKAGFEKSSKRHIKADGGWYLSIPFRTGIPTTIGEANVFAVQSMPVAVHREAKKLEISSSGTSKGLKLSDLPKKYQAQQSRAAVSVIESNKTFEEYKHKSSIYAGIVKKKDAVTGQNKYMSFRRVSDKSDPAAFIHTGIIAYNLAEIALNELNSNMSNELQFATDRALDKLGF